MKKIMFNDRYGLTRAVLEGRKTMTRRIAEKVLVEDIDQHLVWTGEFKKPKYKVGEVVAVAQNYNEVFDEFATIVYTQDKPVPDNFMAFGSNSDVTLPRTMPGWNNKMFVRADLMPHRIRITNVRFERLQDISDEDCLKEGVIENTATDMLGGTINGYTIKGVDGGYAFAREAFSALINRISGRGTWESNPWVFVYEFELVKSDEGKE